jgi:hypothetical protein
MFESTDSLSLKNKALMELSGQHVIIGFHKDSKWVGGKLHFISGLGERGKDDRRPMVWRLDQFMPPRVRGYERPVSVFFVTTDVAWWAPATPRQADKDFEERTEREIAEADKKRRQRKAKKAEKG